MEYFAIRHKPTGHFLPLRAGKTVRGFTYVEPTDKHPPRLFRSRQNAAQALGWWLEGKAQGEWDDGITYFSGKITPVPSRIASEMEIVPITLSV